MNYSVIIYIMGWLLNFIAGFMTLPCIVAVIYGEKTGFIYLGTLLVCLVCGVLITRKKPKNQVFYAREGFVTVSLSWIVISIIGAIPFVISGDIPNPVDAVFETMSGFTTTGASILINVELLPKCHMFWRSFTHWVGGMGVLVFIMSLLPLTGGSHMNLMKAESPGPSVSRLVPKVQETAKILYIIYLAMTVAEFLLLVLFGMPVFDGIITAFGTAGTGGFGIWCDSIGGYKPVLQYIVTIFMILFGVNFNVYFLLMFKKWKQAFQSEEVKAYLGIIAASIIFITYNIRNIYPTFEECFRHAAFTVGSIITTTGFATTDFDKWPEISRTLLVILMFCGACAGSTGGGMKVSRFVILFKTIRKEIHTFLHPRLADKVKLDGKVVEHEVVRSINVYVISYVLIFVVSLIIITFDNFDLTTNFTAIAATFNNIGPGLNMVGPTGNFAEFSNLSKIVMIFDMCAGRLEVFPLLVMFSRDTWRKF